MNLDNANVATVLVALLVLAGCIISVFNPDTLTFQQLLNDAGPLVGGLAVGRGVAAGLKNR